VARTPTPEAPCSLRPMTHGAHGVTVDSDVEGPVLAVTVRGELDMSTSSELSEALAAAADHPVTEVTLDLAGVTFIDSSALRVLVLSGRALAEGGRTLQIGPRSDRVARILTMTHLDAGSDAFRVLPETG
jgi:anti-sigma B factor antagonist